MESFFQRVKIYGEHCYNCLAFQNGCQTSNERKSAVHFQIWSFTYIAGYLSCRMTDIEGFLTIYGHSDNLLNNNLKYLSRSDQTAGGGGGGNIHLIFGFKRGSFSIN